MAMEVLGFLAVVDLWAPPNEEENEKKFVR